MARKSGHGKIPEIRKKSRHNPEVPDLPGPPPRGLFEPWEWPWVKEDLLGPNAPPGPIGFEVGGKIGQTVYQRAGSPGPDGKFSKKKKLQCRRHVIPRDPRTHEQLLARARFQAAVKEACELSESERQIYRERVKRGNLKLNWDNLFIREFCRKHPLHEFQMEAEILRVGGIAFPSIVVMPEVLLMNWQKIYEAELSSADDHTIPGLNGNLHKNYLIVLEGVTGSVPGNNIIGVRPNGAISGYARGVAFRFFRLGGVSFGTWVGWPSPIENILPLGQPYYGNDDIVLVGLMNAKTGMNRGIRSSGSIRAGGYTDRVIDLQVENWWLNTADNITSLILHFGGMNTFTGRVGVYAAEK